MKWLFKWVFRIVFAAVALLLLLLVFKDPILRALIEQRIRAQTGMDAQIGRVSSSFFAPVFTIKDLRLYNTAEFGGTLFLDVPELHVEFDSTAIARHKLHVTLMRFNLAEMDIVKNQAGRTNLISLLAKSQKTASGTGGSQAPSGFSLEFESIDTLNLSVGKVRLVDLKDPNQNREIPIRMQNQIFPPIKTEGDWMGVLAMLELRSSGALGDLLKDYDRSNTKVELLER